MMSLILCIMDTNQKDIIFLNLRRSLRMILISVDMFCVVSMDIVCYWIDCYRKVSG